MPVTDEERMRATKQQTVRSIKDHNLHRKFPISTPFLSNLCQFLQSVEGGSRSDRDSKARTATVSRFLYFCNDEQLDSSYVQNKQSINGYISHMKLMTTIAASSLKNILSSIHDASLFMKNQERTTSHKSIKRYLKTLKKSLSGMHKRRKNYVRLHRLEEDAAVPDLQEAATKLRQYEPTVKRLTETKQGLDDEDRNTVTSYLVSRIAFENGSRPSHVANLTLEELHSSRKVRDEFVALCHYSKNGVAPVTFSKSLFDLTKVYIRNIRNSTLGASGGGHARVFINNKGNAISNISSERHLYKVLRLAGVQRVFSLTQLRKAITSRAVRQYADDPRQLSLFHGYLAHSPQVANMYYQTVNTRQEYHQGYQLVQGVLCV